MDLTKMSHADVRHRAIFHSAFGIYVMQMIFGTDITISTGKKVSVRDIAEQHVIEDLKRIPSMSDYLNEMTIQPWMSGLEVEPLDESAETNKETNKASDTANAEALAKLIKELGDMIGKIKAPYIPTLPREPYEYPKPDDTDKPWVVPNPVIPYKPIPRPGPRWPLDGPQVVD